MDPAEFSTTALNWRKYGPLSVFAMVLSPKQSLYVRFYISCVINSGYNFLNNELCIENIVPTFTR